MLLFTILSAMSGLSLDERVKFATDDYFFDAAWPLSWVSI